MELESDVGTNNTPGIRVGCGDKQYSWNLSRMWGQTILLELESDVGTKHLELESGVGTKHLELESDLL